MKRLSRRIITASTKRALRLSATLYIVATPIGNLDDITFRAVQTLRETPIIACEDTRRAGQLLRYLNLPEKELVSYHNFNERQCAEKLLARLARGESVALVSDAGTPSVSDPGFYLVRAAHREGIRVVPIAGVSALTAAVSVCPLPINRFYFEGFLPHKKGRQTRLKFLAALECAVVLYESPHRIIKLLDEVQTHFGSRQVMIARELTKLYEEILIGLPVDLKEKLSSKKILGEFVIVVSPSAASDKDDAVELENEEERDEAN